MNEQARCVFIQSQIAAAQIEMEGMKAENEQRAHCGMSMAYGTESFDSVIGEYRLRADQVRIFLETGEYPDAGGDTGCPPSS